jgi:hypothetical protein
MDRRNEEEAEIMFEIDLSIDERERKRINDLKEFRIQEDIEKKIRDAIKGSFGIYYDGLENIKRRKERNPFFESFLKSGLREVGMFISGYLLQKGVIDDYLRKEGVTDFGVVKDMYYYLSLAILEQ